MRNQKTYWKWPLAGRSFRMSFGDRGLGSKHGKFGGECPACPASAIRLRWIYSRKLLTFTLWACDEGLRDGPPRLLDCVHCYPSRDACLALRPRFRDGALQAGVPASAPELTSESLATPRGQCEYGEPLRQTARGPSTEPCGVAAPPGDDADTPKDDRCRAQFSERPLAPFPACAIEPGSHLAPEEQSAGYPLDAEECAQRQHQQRKDLYSAKHQIRRISRGGRTLGGRSVGSGNLLFAEIYHIVLRVGLSRPRNP